MPYIYICPESLKITEIVKFLFRNNNISKFLKLITIDECHCCVTMCLSRDGLKEPFRISFGKFLCDVLPLSIRLLLCTGTPTLYVLSKLDELYKEWNLFVLKTNSLDRKNLYYEYNHQSTLKITTYIDKVIDIFLRFHHNNIPINSSNCPTIMIFFKSLDVQTYWYKYIYRKLPSSFNKEEGLKKYHADIGNERYRKKTLLSWVQPLSSILIMLATSALEMGTSKDSISQVIIYGTPIFIENFLQKAGRGGRDKLKVIII